MNELRRLAIPAVVIGVLLVTFPVVELILTVLPPRPSEVSWRYGAGGMASRAIMTPTLGALTMLAGGILAGRRWVVVSVSVVLALGTLALLGVSALFALDAIQMRGLTAEPVRPTFDWTAGVALVKLVAGSFVLALLAWTGWQASRKIPG